MDFALAEAAKALDNGEFPVGCVIVFNGLVVAYGSRKGTSPLSSDTGSPANRPSEIDHAEIRALKFLEDKIAALNNDIDIVTEECVLYCTMEPCLMCFGAIILSGIKKVVYAFEDPMGGGTSCALEVLPPLYQNSRITVVSNVRRSESLNFFARFFSREKNLYWKNSLLEKYTLEQANQTSR
ncbi:MAG: nucleoside deaminase [Desulfamplus sp.]|nr:nucleoside deaminase [Desulfamplus sp.]